MGNLAIFGFGEGGWGLALLQGAAMTLLVSAVGLMIGGIIGGLVAWARLSGQVVPAPRDDPMRRCFAACPNCSSSISSILALRRYSQILPIFSATKALSECLPSRLAHLRSGSFRAPIRRKSFAPPISLLRRGELEAAVSVGMRRSLMFRRIILPQIMRFALPGLGNLWQVALKDSSLISVTGLTELMRVSQVGAGSTHRPFAFYLGGAVALPRHDSCHHDALFDIAEARATRGMRRAAG